MGRESELAQIGLLLAEARSGRAGVVAVFGAAGVGKTALLDSAVGLADGFTVMRVVGVPPEQTISFAALAALLWPLANHVEDLPIRQRRAVLASMARGGAERGAAGDLLALGAGVLALLAEASSARPLFVLVDDLQWVDEESERLIGFVARRLGGERVAMLLAGRAEADLPPGGHRPVELGLLDVGSAGKLLRQRRSELHPDVIRELITRCDGNALALVESAGQLDEEQARGRAELDPERPVPARLRAAYDARLAVLPVNTRKALLLAACEGRGEPSLLVAALRSVGAGQADLDQAAEADLLLLVSGRYRFHHPLLAASVLEAARPAVRREAHAALAAVLAGHDDARAVWHRAAAAAGPDESVVLALTEQAQRAAGTGLPEAAGRAWERAGELTNDGPRRAGLFVAAAEAAVQSGSGARATRLLARVAEAGRPTPQTRARGQVVEGRLALLHDRPGPAARLFLAAAPELAGSSRRQAIDLAIQCAVLLGDRPTAERALEYVAAPDQSSTDSADVYRDVARLLVEYDVGDPAIDPRLTGRLKVLVDNKPPNAPLPALMLLGAAARQIGQLVAARALYAEACAAAAETGDVPGLAGAVSRLAFCDFVLGRWNSAYAGATEVHQLIDEAFAPSFFADALLIQADIDSARGHEQPCRTACTRLRSMAETLDDAYLGVLADRGEGVLDLGSQRLDAAVRRLESAAANAARAGLRLPYASAVPDLAEAYLRQGRRGDAEQIIGGFLSAVGPGSPAPARARALRLRGLLAPRGEYDDDFDTSVALDEAAGLRFHAARTLLCHGERLRRDRQRVAARVRLRRSLDVFVALEAKPWAERAEAELRACGGSSDGATGGSVSAVLTPQELQIAVLVAGGLRNREIAGSLFLSLRTVEFHLGRVFRKLDISSRTQLAARMTD
ncbi:MAG: AAA family ATPase [Geodermatophilaceae bacterium]